MFTVIIPTFNRPHQLERALISLDNQSYKNFKVTISDNSSNNETLITVKKFNNLKIHYIKNNKNIGQKKNFLNLLSHVKTKYFCWLLDDDYFVDDNFFLDVSKNINKNPNVGLIYSGRQLLNHSTNKIYKKFPTKKKYFSSASEWVLYRDKKLILNFSGVFMIYDKYHKDILETIQKGEYGWGIDDLGFIFSAMNGVQQLSGISITLCTHIDYEGKASNPIDFLPSLRRNRVLMINILKNDQIKKNKFSSNAIRKIEKIYSDWSLISAEGFRIFKSKQKNKNQLFFKIIKKNFLNFKNFIFYLPKISVIIILNAFK